MSSSSSSSSSSSTDSFVQNFTQQIYPEFYPKFAHGGYSSNYKLMEKRIIQNFPTMIEQSMQYEKQSKKPRKEKRAYIDRIGVERGNSSSSPMSEEMSRFNNTYLTSVELDQKKIELDEKKFSYFQEMSERMQKRNDEDRRIKKMKLYLGLLDKMDRRDLKPQEQQLFNTLQMELFPPQ